MANNLKKTVRAYIHGSNISKRYIRVEEATGWLSEVYTNIYTKDDKDIGENSYTDIEYTKMLAIAAGALYRMQRIELIHKERLDDFMKHLYKVPGTNKQVVKKFVRIGEGSIIYSIGHVVLETVTPHNMETIKPFEVTVRENNPTKPQVWRIFLDREFSAKLRIIKKDAYTGKTVLIPNTEFKIYNLDKKEYVSMTTTYPSKVIHTSFFTDEDGDLILPDVLNVGNYRIEEIAAPYGYVLNENYVEVAVDSDTFYEVDQDTYEAIITIDYEDQPEFGELTIIKKGEVLDAYEGGFFADSDEKTFIYREGTLAGAKFEVYAAEDIYTADMQLDENGNRTKYYSKDELVATLVTGKDGKATLKDLPLGNYKIVEVEAPFVYVLNKDEQVVTFRYVDDKTPVVYETSTFANERQKFHLFVNKLDEETKKPVPGAVFGLYADEDIKNVDGKVIAEAGTLLETATSDEYGSVRFEKDYPFAKYSAKELTPIRERRKMWESRIPDVLDILKAGSEAAQKKAAATLHDVRSAMKINYFDADGLENDYK